MYYIIVNPMSRTGRGQEYWNRILPILEEKKVDYQVRFSREIGHTAKLVRNLCEKHKEDGQRLHLIILGGDGTINEAVQGIVDFDKVLISYIPTGSSNDLARDMGISKEPEEALQAILENRREITMDVGKVHYGNASYYGTSVEIPDRRFLVGCGIGFDAAVCETAMHSKMKGILNRLGLGKLTYLGIALRQLMAANLMTAEVTLDGGEPMTLDGVFFIVGMQHRYEGGGFMFCPAADAEDGMMDVCTVSGVSKPGVLRILPTAFSGKHVKFSCIGQYRAKEVRIKTELPLWVHTDGEVEAASSEICITMAKEKIKFVY